MRLRGVGEGDHCAVDVALEIFDVPGVVGVAVAPVVELGVVDLVRVGLPGSS